MAETNGNRDARMDRIERTMEMFAADHEQFRDEHKKLLIAQVVQQGEIDRLLNITQEHTRRMEAEGSVRRATDAALDKPIGDLVASIADLIRRIPSECSAP
jgi:hypothetical protein